jgi:hypothetical protein
MTTAKQLAQLRDQLITLENNPAVLTEAGFDKVKNLFGVGKAAPQVARELRQGATAVVNNKSFILDKGQWYELNTATGLPTRRLATGAEADAARLEATGKPINLMHPDAARIPDGTESIINNTKYIKQKDGTWMELENGVTKKVGPAEQHAAELAAVEKQKLQPPNTAAQQPGATAAAEQTFTKKQVEAIAAARATPEQIEQAEKWKSIMARGLLYGTASTFQLWDAWVKYQNEDYEGALKTGASAVAIAAPGFIQLKYSLGGAAVAGIIFLIIKAFGKDPLTDDEKQHALQLASWYYNNNRTLNPAANTEEPKASISPRLWDYTERAYKAMQDKKPNPPTDGGLGKKPAAASTATNTKTKSIEVGAPAATPAPAAATPAAPAATPAPAATTPAPATTPAAKDEVDDVRKNAGIPSKPPAEPAPSKPGRLKFS